MPHINNEPGQHDPTVSAYIVRLDTAEPRLLLHKHKKLHRYLQFGGHIELDENPWQAITHELLEESGYEIGQLKVLQPRIRLTHLTGVIIHPCPVSYLTHKFESLEHHHTDVAFAFVTDELPRHSVQNGESAHTELFTADGLRTLSGTEIYENVREIGLFILEQVIRDWDAVSSQTWA